MRQQGLVYHTVKLRKWVVLRIALCATYVPRARWHGSMEKCRQAQWGPAAWGQMLCLQCSEETHQGVCAYGGKEGSTETWITVQEECQLTLQVATEKEIISVHKVACWWQTDIWPHTAPWGLDLSFLRSCSISDSMHEGLQELLLLVSSFGIWIPSKRGALLHIPFTVEEVKCSLQKKINPLDAMGISGTTFQRCRISPPKSICDAGLLQPNKSAYGKVGHAHIQEDCNVFYVSPRPAESIWFRWNPCPSQTLSGWRKLQDLAPGARLVYQLQQPRACGLPQLLQFNLQRGIRQGSILSPSLFLLCLHNLFLTLVPVSSCLFFVTGQVGFIIIIINWWVGSIVCVYLW